MPQLGPEPFVGRVAELSWLTHAFDRARSGEGSLTGVGRAVENATVAYRPWRQAFRRLGLAFSPR